MSKFVWLGAIGMLAGAAGCSGEASEPSAAEREALYVEGRVPLPDCPDFDYGRCDVQEPACVENLAGIAHCLRGGGTSLAVPQIRYLSEAQVVEELISARSDAEPRPEPDHFEIALQQFGLTQSGAFQPAESARRFAETVGAYYTNSSKEIVVVEHPPDPTLAEPEENPIWRLPLLLHELVHALQDEAHDLSSFGEQYRQDTDANLRGSSIIEGEARLHERRYYAALIGLDIEALDVESNFEHGSDFFEDWLFEQPDLYSSSPSSVPYGAGAEYVYGIWREGGAEAVRALFDTPPLHMQQVLARVWGGEPNVESVELTEPVEGEVPDATLAGWSTLGAWMLYTLAEPLSPNDRDRARQLALDWRGDRFEAFATSAGATAARWRLVFADAAAASRAALLLGTHRLLDVTDTGAELTLTPK